LFQLFRHLAWVLGLALTLALGVIDLGYGADAKTLITCLAPALWLGLYVLGSDHPTDEAV